MGLSVQKSDAGGRSLFGFKFVVPTFTELVLKVLL
jgi:hypothetical protein